MKTSFSKLSQALERLLGARVKRNEPLRKHSSLRIGGPAALWVEPHTVGELTRVSELTRSHHAHVEVVGLGSNTLFPDDGIDGVVIRLAGELAELHIERDDDDGVFVRVGAGMLNAHLVRKLVKAGLTGAEFLKLIPGTFGGSVAMNAGTKEQWISTILVDATLLVPVGDEFVIRRVTVDELELRYRHATLPEGSIVVDASIQLARGDVEAANARADFDKQRRARTQPYKLASVGSTFTNPEGDYAGRLIEAVGLKGAIVGGAQVSPLHANFFINQDGATARDFLTLMARARVAVRREFGVELHPEVRFVGFDGWSLLEEIERQELFMFEHVDTQRFVGQRVGVLFGGSGPERPISLKTGRALAGALRDAGHDVIEYDLPAALPDLVSSPPAAVLLGLHGDGEDGTVQGLLEVLGVPYTGSGVLASALSMDKARAKAVMDRAGVPLADGFEIPGAKFCDLALSQALEGCAWARDGYILKPTDGGSSVGVYLVKDEATRAAGVAGLQELIDAHMITGVVVERLLSGPEYSVGFFGDVCLGAIHITPAQEFYDFHAKYESQETSYAVVEDLALARRLEDVAGQAWRALGCRGVGRVDVMADGEALFVLEANTIPGMTATSLVPKLAAGHGIDFARFADLMLSSATTDQIELRGASREA